jgi:hypothetical protein
MRWCAGSFSATAAYSQNPRVFDSSVLSLALACAGFGWSGRRMWVWRLAVTIIAIQVIGDLINTLGGGL